MKTSAITRHGVSPVLAEIISKLVSVMPWPARRRLMGYVAIKILDGKSRVAEDVFGWKRTVVEIGIKEFQSGLAYEKHFSVRYKPTTEEKHPELFEDIRKIMEPCNQDGRRLKTTLLHKKMTAQSVFNALVAKGWSKESLPTVRTISNILNRHWYRLR